MTQLRLNIPSEPTEEDYDRHRAEAREVAYEDRLAARCAAFAEAPDGDDSEERTEMFDAKWDR